MPDDAGGLSFYQIGHQYAGLADEFVAEEDVPLRLESELQKPILEVSAVEIELHRLIPFRILAALMIRRCLALLLLRFPPVAATGDGHDGVDGGFLEESEVFHTFAGDRAQNYRSPIH